MSEFDQYRAIFLAEAAEYLQDFSDALLSLEREDSDREAVLAEMFRLAHSLKGMAATMGYDQITELTHALESLLDKLRSGLLSPAPQIVDLLFAAVDILQQLLAHVTEPEQTSGICREMIAHLEKIGEAGDGEPPAAEQGVRPRSGLPLLEACVTLKQDTQLPSVRAYMVIKVLEENGVVLSTSPSREIIDNDQTTSFSVLFQSESDPAGLQEAIARISEVEAVEIHTRGDNAGRGSRQTSVQPAGESPTVRVDTVKLDRLVDLTGELTLAQTRLQALFQGKAAGEQEEVITHLSRLISRLQEEVMGLRMVPVQQIFNRFPRLLRDLCRDSGKKVRLQISGGETEVDRGVMNRISEPLVHLLRNAVDHGIESPAQRRVAGKNEEGLIHLRAWTEGNQVTITISDDGAGLDARKIAASAVRKGLISESQVAGFSDPEKIDLIFYPGFSTADKVTEISGRGVGMDVVKQTLEEVHGYVEIDSSPNKGTTFALRIPLTLAIIKGLVVRTGQQRYVLPLTFIQETLFMDKDQILTARGDPVISLRGELISVFSLGGLMGLGQEEGDDGGYYVVIVADKGRKAAITVDALLGQQDTVIKSLNSFGQLAGVAGATIMGDGTVALIVDILKIIETGGTQLSKTALITDDTAFMRMTLRNVLQKNGFEVIGEAEDGQQAVELYQQLKPFLVTMDITMPNKDGLTAIREILALDPEARIVVVSAMGQKGLVIDALNAGARDFVVKPFQPDRICEALQKLV